MDKETTQLTLRLPKALMEQVREEARRQGQMASAAYIRLAVTEKLERDAGAEKRRN